MITTLVLLTLVYAILGKPVGRLVKKLEGVDWKNLALDAWDKIKFYAKRCGRAAARPLLFFYHVMQDEGLSTLEKALVYAGILYIAVPGDLLPRRILGWIGVLDDVAVAAWIYKKIEGHITPAIEAEVEKTLDGWFGPEIITGLVADLGKE